jgi:acyl-coenzyme A synthetase/AMP-(fatty) acid ligase
MSATAEPMSLSGTLAASPGLASRQLWSAGASLALADIAHGTALDGAAPSLAGRSVLVRVADPLYAAIALIELDGVARRIVLCPPDLADEALPGVIEVSGAEMVVSEAPLSGDVELPLVRIALPVRPLDAPRRLSTVVTEWVMFTSGTSGAPKLVAHNLAGLTGAIKPAAAGDAPPVWGTFYDIRRYGGLQILLRALLGEGSMVMTAPGEPMGAFFARLAAHGVTHLTGTPSHWRRVLMSPEAAVLSPRYVRLSGEIADQAVLDALKTRFPGVPVGHAYASTEAGVGFEVNDGLAGFPADYIGRPGAVELAVEDGSLRLRSPRAASGYLNPGAPALVGGDGFVDSGDMVELRGDRYHFVGRRNGVINVGGLKAHPEEIEAVINRHPAVRMCRVRARRNPITGAIVVAEVVLNDAGADAGAVKPQILDACRRELAPFKVPAMVSFVPALALTAGGKLERAVA